MRMSTWSILDGENEAIVCGIILHNQRACSLAPAERYMTCRKQPKVRLAWKRRYGNES